LFGFLRPKKSLRFSESLIVDYNIEHYGVRGNTPFEAHNGHLSGHYITDNNTPAD